MVLIEKKSSNKHVNKFKAKLMIDILRYLNSKKKDNREVKDIFQIPKKPNKKEET